MSSKSILASLSLFIISSTAFASGTKYIVCDDQSSLLRLRFALSAENSRSISVLNERGVAEKIEIADYSAYNSFDVERVIDNASNTQVLTHFSNGYPSMYDANEEEYQRNNQFPETKIGTSIDFEDTTDATIEQLAKKKIYTTFNVVFTNTNGSFLKISATSQEKNASHQYIMSGSFDLRLGEKDQPKDAISTIRNGKIACYYDWQ